MSRCNRPVCSPNSNPDAAIRALGECKVRPIAAHAARQAGTSLRQRYEPLYRHLFAMLSKLPHQTLRKLFARLGMGCSGEAAQPAAQRHDSMVALRRRAGCRAAHLLLRVADKDQRVFMGWPRHLEALRPRVGAPRQRLLHLRRCSATRNAGVL
jgi:hypothetical protein